MSARKLLVDIGNTRIKWAFHDGRLGPVSALVHKGEDPESIAARLWGDGEKPAALLIASVANAALASAISRWFWQRWALQATRLSATAECLGLKNAYAEPARLGVDRWLAMIAAFRRVGGAVIVLDGGSAITLDAVTAAGAHLGGIIVPGPEMLWRSFYSSAAVVAMEDMAFEANPFGRSTGQAVGGGALLAARGGVELSIRRMKAVLGENTPVLVTGGGVAKVLGERLEDWPAGWIACPDLVLEGIALVGG